MGQRVTGRQTKNRTVIADGYSLLRIICHVLKDLVEYMDLGRDCFDKLNPKRLVPYLVDRLKNIDYELNLVAL